MMHIRGICPSCGGVSLVDSPNLSTGYCTGTVFKCVNEKCKHKGHDISISKELQRHWTQLQEEKD